MFIEIQHSGEIAGITDVHGIRNRSLRGAWAKLSRVEILRDNVIRVRGCNEPQNRQPHAFRHEPGGAIAQIAARNGKDQRESGLLDLAPSRQPQVHPPAYTSTVHSLPESRPKYSIKRALKRAPKSLNASVGP